MKNFIVHLLSIVLSISMISSCKDTSREKHTTTVDQPMNHDTMPADKPEMDHSMMQPMTKMMDEMENMQMSGDVDPDFANMMIIHHQVAVDMSVIELAKGTDAQAKAMAQKIITAQKAEIDQFRQVINSYQPTPKKAADHTHSLDESMTDMMDGMEAKTMSGNMDKDFVMMIIPHHEGAIAMSEYELSHGTHTVLKKMAKQIIDDQKKEIADFKTWLSQN